MGLVKKVLLAVYNKIFIWYYSWINPSLLESIPIYRDHNPDGNPCEYSI